jgi:ribosome-associated translation inhibitor RaiA
MKETANMSNYTARTTFLNMPPSDAVMDHVQKEADKLSKYFDRITSCSVVIEAPHGHKNHHGEPFHVRIELGVPGKELVVAHNPSARRMLDPEEEARVRKNHEVEGPHKDLYVAIRDAFLAIRRQLQDYVHCLRNEVKTHPA